MRKGNDFFLSFNAIINTYDTVGIVCTTWTRTLLCNIEFIFKQWFIWWSHSHYRWEGNKGWQTCAQWLLVI